MKSIILFFLALSVTTICFAQSSQTESLTITTYFPSPEGVFNKLEVHSGLVVGNISNSYLGYTSISDLSNGQIYVGDRIILNNQTTQPESPSEGQLFYNTTDNVLEFYNNTSWVKIGG